MTVRTHDRKYTRPYIPDALRDPEAFSFGISFSVSLVADEEVDDTKRAEWGREEGEWRREEGKGRRQAGE